MKSSMAEENSPKEEKLDLAFAALSDRTRRSLLLRLSRGEASVMELAEPFRMSLAAVGKHLRVLENAGLVKRTIRGRHHHLSFSPEPLKGLERWLDYYRLFWKENLDELARYAEEKETKTARRPRKAP